MITLFGVLFAICVVLLIATAAGSIAQRKGRTFWLYFVAALIVGPLALLGHFCCRDGGLPNASRVDSQP
jgi:hypothetical protein